MVQDSEKRFHSIMDKLFDAPKSIPNPSSSSEVQLWRGKKRANPMSALALVDPKRRGNRVEGFDYCSAPLCRPWDRGDLMRRVATFKSMTWFAKPKVVSAVNCARRGWVNLDTDIIACESCGARLLLSNPSCWTQQQVEKAALVFSLKLDNGHKLLCPWIDNACDETLAQFPPTTPPLLVDKFRECSSALLQLLALPVISSSAIEYMRSPQLEEFLRQSSTLEFGDGSADICQIESIGNEVESDSANLYYQAQKVISLCGWEPRSLPYVVDCKDIANQFVKDTNILNSSHAVANGKNSSISIHSAGTNEIMEANENSWAHNAPQSDPKSVVLDCRLCGASVGLWAFSTVPRPVELFRLVGYTEVDGEKNSETNDVGIGNNVDSRGGVLNTASDGVPSQKDSVSNLNLTIAGGPLPTKQNFKATISLPVIGRNLRAKFSCDTYFTDHIRNKQETSSGSKKKDLLQEENDCTEYNLSGQVQLELKSKRHDQEHCISTSDDQSPSLIHGISEKGDIPRKENNDHMPLEGPIESTQNVVQDLLHSDGSENAENVGSVNSTLGDFGSSQAKDSSITTPDVNVSTGTGESSKNDLLMVTSDSCNLQQIPGMDIVRDKEISLASNQESSCFASCLEARVNVDSNVPNTLGARVNKEGVACGREKDLKQLPVDQAMKFDPIKQHRHFCPWIVSTGGGLPGWQQMLSALQRQKERFHPSPTKSPPSGSIIEMDDPISSVRRLFMSPPAKRVKTSGGSS